MVLGIIRQSEGHIDVESRPEVGTNFQIYLPAVQGLAEGPAQSAPFKPVGGSETVLLVEDEEPVRNVTTLLLETLGYRVLGAENGQDALRLFEASREKIDLLMTDVVMPDLRPRGSRGTSGQGPGVKGALPERLYRRYSGSLGRFARRSGLPEKAHHARRSGQKDS